MTDPTDAMDGNADGQEFGDEVYQPQDGPEGREDDGVLDPEDTLNERVAEPYDEGYSPPERPLGVDHHGTTAREQREGESLDERLAEERPDPAAETPLGTAGPAGDTDGAGGAGDGVGDLPGGEGEPLDDQVGEDRAGRLVAPDEGAREDAEKDMVAEDVGISGGAASAEEAAVHRVPDEDERSR